MVTKSLVTQGGDGTAVPSGMVGEVISQERLRASALTITNGTVANVTANPIPLTPGRWIINAAISIETGAATTLSEPYFSISLASATINGPVGTHNSSGEIQKRTNISMSASVINQVDILGMPINITSNANYYVTVRANLTGTVTTFGSIWATRIA